MKSLAGRTAFLTGAAAGIGRELAVTLFDAGTVLGGLLDDTAPRPGAARGVRLTQV